MMKVFLGTGKVFLGEMKNLGGVELVFWCGRVKGVLKNILAAQGLLWVFCGT